jgi:hypothetical protein
VSELGERVRRQRGDDQKVGAHEVRVQIFLRSTPRQRVEGLGAHEALGARRDERDDLVSCAHEEPNELARLVSGDPTGDPDQDPRHRRLPTSCSRA